MTITFAFTGEYGVGKTFAAKRMAKLTACQQFALADGIREELASLFGIDVQKLYAKPTPPEVRELIVAWGESRKASMGKLYWCDVLMARAPKHMFCLTIGDLRFKHELDYFANQGRVKLIYVGDRPSDNAGYELSQLWHLADYIISARAKTLDIFLEDIKNDTLKNV